MNLKLSNILLPSGMLSAVIYIAHILLGGWMWKGPNLKVGKWEIKYNDRKIIKSDERHKNKS